MIKMQSITFDDGSIDSFFETSPSHRGSAMERFYRGYAYFFLMPYGTDSRAAEDHEVELMCWCVDQFGPPHPRWGHFTGAFGFADAADATAFRLRWC